MLEVVVAYAWVEAALWTSGKAQAVCAAVAVLWVVFATLRSGRSARQLGISSDGLRASWWIIPAALACSAGMLATASVYGTFHGLSGARTPPWHVVLYAMWALVQEFLVQSFIFVRLEPALRGGARAVFWTAVLFSVAHIPNPVLMPATFIFALLVCAAFRRYRNIYPLAFAHAMLGLTLAVSIPNVVTHYMHVGIAYF